MANVSSFLRAVYLVGVTDLRPYFTQRIGHNSVNVHRISTKFGSEICLNEPFKCAEVQPAWSTHPCFMADFAKCAKRSRRKNEENPPNYGRSYLGNDWGDFLHNLYVDSPTAVALL